MSFNEYAMMGMLILIAFTILTAAVTLAYEYGVARSVFVGMCIITAGYVLWQINEGERRPRQWDTCVVPNGSVVSCQVTHF